MNLNDVAKFMSSNGWHVKFEQSPEHFDFLEDFPHLVAFVENVRSCISPDEQVWLFGWEDFSDNSNEGWRFLELSISLPSAEGDHEWSSQIREFWAAHVPFAMSVRSGYSALLTDRSGRIYLSVEPEFEEPIVVAENFGSFLVAFRKQIGSGKGRLAEFFRVVV